MFPIFRGWSLRRLAIVTYETATRSVAVDQQWTLYTTALRRHATILMFGGRWRCLCYEYQSLTIPESFISAHVTILATATCSNQPSCLNPTVVVLKPV
jgi:hypothetical protein